MQVRHKGLALTFLALTQLMIVLDSSIVNVALPAVQKALHFSNDSLQWTVNAYTLLFGGFLLLGGRLADRLGRKRIFISGLILFVVASVVAGAAQSSGMLIIARGVQGLGGAMMSPAALSMLTVIFAEGQERNKALGVWGAVAAGGAAVGLLAGGVLVQWLDWRWVFWVNIPFGAAALLGAIKYLPESSDPDANGFDLAGAFTVTAGLIALVYALVRGNDVGWATGQTIVTFAIAIVLLVSFYFIEKNGSHPLLPLRIFQNRNVVGADTAILLVGAAMFGMFFYISLYLQSPDLMGYSAIKTGLAFLPVSLAIMVSAGVGSSLLTKFGAKRIASVGLVIAPIGMLLLARIHPGGSYVVDVLIPLIIMSVGLGATFVSLTAAAVTGVSHSDSGLASALLNTGQQIGGALGLAMLTAVSTGRTKSLIDSGSNVAGATTSGYAWGFIVCAVLMLGGAAVATALIQSHIGETESETQNEFEGAVTA